jgi:hypothetical protein
MFESIEIFIIGLLRIYRLDKSELFVIIFYILSVSENIVISIRTSMYIMQIKLFSFGLSTTE